MKKVIVLLLSAALLIGSVFMVGASSPSISAEKYSENVIPIMTSNSAPLGIASASNSYSDGLSAWKAFDGNKFYSTENTSYTAWGTGATKGWLAYEFSEPKIISKYVIYFGSSKSNNTNLSMNPKNWTFEGSNNGTEWTTLDTQTNVSDWELNVHKEFSFANETLYKKYRINIAANNGATSLDVNLTIHEFGMMEKIGGAEPSPIPTPTSSPMPTPTPTSVPESGNRAILIITMDNGLEKEFDLPIEDVNAFMIWYENKETGTGSAKFGINKYDNNKGPFKKRTDYVIFDKILTFEVNEYDLIK
ncbi:discoidin domain-containing protein [Paenibacillus sp. L3-i20]|uniref:discoidin domain-containing protein n=1 Tax=Paenibacillus sp. L3-i20 TaxID=2905833 RepID=UPI001EDD54E2|nr:discoidin domain-containing protein [Paenibacillus sp. L3-i20]GKU76801.1 hypothetical protein L3i20_v211980 [Paenibacillus sp. L3-i20]